MTNEAANTAAPAVGIFWGVVEDDRRPMLLADLAPLELAEPYGEFLTYGGHYEHWEKLAAIGIGELRRHGLPTAPTWSEYEEWPRGRVVLHNPTQRFVVYVDSQLRQPSWLGMIVQRFGLPADRIVVRGDHHYISTRKVRSP